MSTSVTTSPMVRRSLDWIGQAPIVFQSQGSTSASPEAVFAVLADHERWPEWFPAVKQVEVLGAATGVGATRRVRIPGSVVDEEFIAWDEGVRWAFTGTGAKPGFLRSLVEDCRLSVTDGRTQISYAMYLEPKGLLRPMLKLGAAPMRSNIAKAIRNLAERAERAERA